MAKISFGKTVKYQGSVYPPNTAFEVLDADVEDLKKAGGWVKEQEISPEAEKGISEPLEESEGPETPLEEENTEEEQEEDLTEAKSEYELLKEKADKLGVEYKGNWGVKKLSEAIAEVEEA